MEDAGGESAHAEGEKHVAELADGGIGEDFLDVGLDEGDGGGEDGGCGADDGDDVHGYGGKLKDGAHARDHINAGGDHSDGVYERTDRRGALRSVGEPDVERDLRGFSGGAEEEKQGDGGKD